VRGPCCQGMPACRFAVALPKPERVGSSPSGMHPSLPYQPPLIALAAVAHMSIYQGVKLGKVQFRALQLPLHAAGLTGVLAAAAMMRHTCTPQVATLGLLNPYVAAAFEEWGLGSGGASSGGKHGLTAVVARQPAAAPPSAASPAAGVQGWGICFSYAQARLSWGHSPDRVKSQALCMPTFARGRHHNTAPAYWWLQYSDRISMSGLPPMLMWYLMFAATTTPHYVSFSPRRTSRSTEAELMTCTSTWQAPAPSD
jgi:hypothetical protein